jgi:membrane protein implicated in regulation of membrane protease activity
MINDTVNAISQGLVLVIQSATLITLIYAFVRFTQKPTDSLGARIAVLEAWKVTVDNRLDAGDVHFNDNDLSNRVTQSALLTILDAFTTMDSVPETTKAEIKAKRNELYSYLAEK